MMKKIFTLLMFPVVLLTGVSAQSDSLFSTEQGVFLEEFQRYVLQQNRELEPHLEAFVANFEGKMDDFSREAVINTANRMRGKRLPAIPLYDLYINAVNAFFGGEEMEEASFRNWDEVFGLMIEQVENRKLNPVLDFLGFSASFFSTGLLRYSKLGTSWKARGGEWSFQYEEGQPRLLIPATDLLATRKEDSILLSGTSGAFYPLETLWKGQGGQVSWDQFEGMEAVYAELSSYQIPMDKGLFTAENVRLHYPLYFDQRLVAGRLENKLVVSNTATESSYPRFESYEKLLEIDRFGKGVAFRGGFRLQGTTIYGEGTAEQPATVVILDEQGKEILFRAKAGRFTIRREELAVGEKVEASLYLQRGDSLYHPSVSMRFDIPERVLQLTRGKSGNGRYPFFSSFHGVNIDAENLLAFIDADSLVIGQTRLSLATRKKASFESLNLFDPSEYYRLQNISSVNPIAVLRRTAAQQGTRFLPADYVATQINPRYTVESIKSLLYDLVAKGFIGYDADRQTVEVKDKVFLYADADQGKVDYDQINIQSVNDSANAVLNLRNEAMQIYGVKNLEFSGRQRVAVIPENQRLTLKEDRNLEFHGLVYAGFSTFEGRWFHFDYQPFQIRMDSIDHFDLYLQEGEASSGGQGNNVFSLESRIENLSGVLLIDAPANKSGRDNILMFPSFQSKGDAYVYYDVDSTFERESFYFKLKPFSFDNLDQFSAQDLSFAGTMVSGGIFPDFEHTLSFQPGDRSLGFKHALPDAGMPVYGGMATYKGMVSLNSSGMSGKGNLTYQNASIDAEDFVFGPQEMTVSAEAFDLEEVRTAEKEIPEVHGDSVSIVWKPYKDSMYVNSAEGTPFALFKDYDVNLEGTLVLTSGGLNGIGRLEWDRASMNSQLFYLGAGSARADTSSVAIKAPGSAEEANAIYTEGVKGEVDFDEQLAHFESYDGRLETNLPYNQYKTSMNAFTWKMDQELINFESEPGQPGLFTSVHPDQDSLAFEAETAAYDLTSNDLKLGGVPYILTCDAFVYPDSNRVFIRPGGVIPTLTNARIVADTNSRYHVINRASVDILGKKLYRASGYYEYNIGDREQEILFENIVGQRVGKGQMSEKATETRATGEVAPEDSLYIDFKTRFQGKISLNARSKNLYFDGFARLEADRLPERPWFRVTSEADKKDLAIEFDQPKRIDGQPLYTGMFISRETANFYPRAIMPLGFRKDRAVLPVAGLMKYRLKDDVFVFGDSAKVAGGALTGNQLIYRNKSGKVSGEGRFNIGSELKYIKVDAAGEMHTTFPQPQDSAQGPYAANPVEARLMAGIHLILPDKLLQIMLNEIQAGSFDAKTVNYLMDINFYKKAAYELFPSDDLSVRESIESISNGFLELPPKVNDYTFLFSDVPMTWSPDLQSFISTEKEVGLASINGQPVHRKLECYLEFKMPTNLRDRLYLYISSPSGLYYFFGFREGILNVTSNNSTFMDELLALKKKDTIIKMDDNHTYEILVVEPRTARLFLRRIKAITEGTD